ncbi:MAG: alpha/beta fold hydrolase [Acidimicrobiia bacterium]
MLKNYGALFGERFDTGPPEVLALHGWGRDRTDFHEALRGVDAVAVDLPGFGASPAPEAPMGTTGYAAVCTPVLGDFVDPPILLGHSFGGRVALRLALDNQVRALVLVGVPLVQLGGTGPSLRFRVWKSLHQVGAVSSERMEAVRQKYGSADYRAARGVMRDVLVRVLSESYEDELDQLTCPVELIWGSDDEEVPLDVAEQARRLIPTSELTVLPGVGHQLPREAPQDLRAVLERLI